VKAIVLSWDRHRVITRHMIEQYARLWPDHPFVFRIPYQRLRGKNTDREHYIETPADIPGTVLRLINDLDDEEWVYWCSDDKYPIQLVTPKFIELFDHVRLQPDVAALLCCRCRITLEKPELSLFPRARPTANGDVLLERRRWYQIWIHQYIRVKVLRYLFRHMKTDIRNAKVMDELKDEISKPGDLRLFVTRDNYAVFGESTQRGVITQNCYRSIKAAGLSLPTWFQRDNGNYVTMGELAEPEQSRWSKLVKGMAVRSIIA